MSAPTTLPDVRRVADADALLDLVDDDYLRWNVRRGARGEGWAVPGATAWTWRGGPRRGPWAAVLGSPNTVAALAAVVLVEAFVRPQGLTLTAAARPLLPEAVRLDAAATHAWEWMRTYAAPPVQPHEDEVAWLHDSDDEEVAALLDAVSPRHSARPGERHVLRWCGIRAADTRADGGLVAIGAHVAYQAGVPHLASIAVPPQARGRGYGAAVTAWLTRACLAEGAPVVTLGMYSDNDVARRLYHRLGFSCDHAFVSGPLIATDDPDQRGGTL